MNKLAMLWVQSAVRLLGVKAIENPMATGSPLHNAQVNAALFLESLCHTLLEMAEHFNNLVKKERPELVLNIFRMGPPRSGLMLLRGRDKLVVNGEGLTIRVRAMQVNAYEERLVFETLFSQIDPGNEPSYWVEEKMGLVVDPSGVACHHLGRFLVFGCGAFASSLRGGATSNTHVHVANTRSQI